QIFELENYTAAACCGPSNFEILTPQNTIPMPHGSELMFLPDRSPIVFNPQTNTFETIFDNPYEPGACLFPVSVFCSPGYVLSHVSAFVVENDCVPLPLFSYGAVALDGDNFRVAAIQVDREPRQDLRRMPISKVRQGVKKLEKLMPNNRLRQHLSHCALVYACPAAKNFFIGRCEAPLPTSTSCNARCLACLSSPDNCASRCSQERMTFTPTANEIAEVALHHIKKVKNGIVSFGQGCEGDPLMASHVIEPAIQMIRQQTDQGTINLNTNASRPDLLEPLFSAGLDSIRVSINSLQPDVYLRYFRPVNYTFAHVMKSIEMALSHDKHVALNYLNCPGFTDTPQELSALEQFLHQYPIHLIQWRNLNIDPLWYYSELFDNQLEIGMGTANLLAHLRNNFPKLRFGYFNPSKENYMQDRVET
ncbi:MAG: radical SAM domain family protein, partial [Candidatus Magnetoglobus multicellularis str. Araruama]